jgi:ubiquinone biosynthesis protein
MRLFRLFKIIITLHQYGLYQILRDHQRTNLLALFLNCSLFYIPKKSTKSSLPVRTRLAFEELGPVFVKFGQLLSTRPDLIPPAYISELSKLQSHVKPFAGSLARKIVERAFGRQIEDVFSEFSIDATASASIAQVHKAKFKDSAQLVAVKVLRPNVEVIINKDIKVLETTAYLVEKLFSDGKLLKPREVVEEFKKTIHGELDLLQEAGNASELYRLHETDHKIIVPKMFFDYCHSDVIVMEWMDGIPISDIKSLKAHNIDLEQLSHNGVEIFYTQVFHYGFFHADMHPGNILCNEQGQYIALDFGIVGCLSEQDKRYLALNILAFFNRDYKKVAITHIESGWAPKNTSVEELENAVRAVCEPIFNKPLAEIAFSQVLIKLFQVSRRFSIAIQPQLILLQKTIVNVEGIGRMLNPELDLWVTAKPILEKWIKKQMGIKGLLHNLYEELPYWSYTLPSLPRAFANSLLAANEAREQNTNYLKLLHSYKRQNQLFILIIVVLIVVFFIKLH